MQRAIFELAPTPPYDFDLTAQFATYFRGRYGTDAYENGEYRRLLDLDDGPVLVKARSTGTVDSPAVTLELAGRNLTDASVADSRDQAGRLLGVHDDLETFYRTCTDDPHLTPFVRGLRGLHVPSTASVYEALIFAILGQQISTHVARMLRTSLIERYGSRLQADGTDQYAFPRPEALVSAGVKGLRAIKLSERKAEYVLDIASQVASGDLDLEGLIGLPAEDAVEALTALRGVGTWTAQWLLVRALGHSDGFPDGDLALQRTLGDLVNGGERMSAKQALDYSQRWVPHRSYVTTYLFAAVRSGRFAELSPSAGLRR